MIDHIGISVSNFAASKAFYTQVLGPIAYQLLMERSAAFTGSHGVARFGEPPNLSPITCCVSR